MRPTAELGTYRGIEVGRREPSVDRRGHRRRDRRACASASAHLHTVKRPAKDGDFLTIDFEGTVDGEPFPGGEGRDQLVELGSGNLIPGFEEGLIGAVAGEQRTVKATFPEDYGAKHVAGKDAEFEITVKDVKHKHLPDLDDDFASDAAGFDTLEELRENITRAHARARRGARRVGVPRRRAGRDRRPRRRSRSPTRSSRRAPNELLTRMLHALGHQGIDKAALPEDLRQDRARARRRRQARGRAGAASARRCSRRSSRPRQIEPTEQQLLDALEGAAEREQMSRQKLLDRLRKAGRVDALAKEIAAEQAIDLVVDARPSRSRSRRRRSAREKRPRRPPRRRPRPKPKRKPAGAQEAREAQGRAVDARQGRRGRRRQEALDAGLLTARRPSGPEAGGW